MRRIALLVNPSAGGGRAAHLQPEVEAALTRLGLPHRVERTESLDHARGLAGTAAEAGEVVVTLSGDGLIGAVAGVLHQHDGAVLGVLPGGRGNDFCRVLGIPLEDIPAACAVLRDGAERPLDLGCVDGNPFIGIASLGFDSEANRIANEAPARLGNLVYVYGAIRALVAWRPARFDLELDGGERHTYVGWSVGACNSKAYGGGMYAAPDAELDDGLLDIVVATTMSKRRFLTVLMPRVFKGTHVDMPEVHVLRTRSLRVEADRPFVVYADGDPIGHTPTTIEVLPAALKVLCPGTIPTGAAHPEDAPGMVG
jgi:YegS/Rv2252/BmrU family lipid kinase